MGQDVAWDAGFAWRVDGAVAAADNQASLAPGFGQSMVPIHYRSWTKRRRQAEAAVRRYRTHVLSEPRSTHTRLYPHGGKLKPTSKPRRQPVYVCESRAHLFSDEFILKCASLGIIDVGFRKVFVGDGKTLPSSRHMIPSSRALQYKQYRMPLP